MKMNTDQMKILKISSTLRYRQTYYLELAVTTVQHRNYTAYLLFLNRYYEIELGNGKVTHMSARMTCDMHVTITYLKFCHCGNLP